MPRGGPLLRGPGGGAVRGGGGGYAGQGRVSGDVGYKWLAGGFSFGVDADLRGGDRFLTAGEGRNRVPLRRIQREGPGWVVASRARQCR